MKSIEIMKFFLRTKKKKKISLTVDWRDTHVPRNFFNKIALLFLETNIKLTNIYIKNKETNSYFA